MLQLDHHELGRLQRRAAELDSNDAAVDEVGIRWIAAVEGALAEQPVKKGADVQPDVGDLRSCEQALRS